MTKTPENLTNAYSSDGLAVRCTADVADDCTCWATSRNACPVHHDDREMTKLDTATHIHKSDTARLMLVECRTAYAQYANASNATTRKQRASFLEGCIHMYCLYTGQDEQDVYNTVKQTCP